jgi:Fe2+ transport system protein FeoA
MPQSTEKSVQLSHAKTGQTYQVCQNACSESLSQKLTLMGLGMGMVIELIAMYKHGAVISTSFGNIAVGSDLIKSISVSLI